MARSFAAKLKFACGAENRFKGEAVVREVSCNDDLLYGIATETYSVLCEVVTLPRFQDNRKTVPSWNKPHCKERKCSVQRLGGF